MSYAAAFILRLALTASWYAMGAADVAEAASMLRDAADDYDAPTEPPPWLHWNAPGGKA